ncbi:hypothetical protein BUQ74_10265 [Leptospira weilii serovar Heyan]|nr:hypothetical protein BUQ74_10265 [Leptospira weilii serovar Heyan]
MDAWHKNWHFHFTPTYSSWINQVEIFFDHFRAVYM